MMNHNNFYQVKSLRESAVKHSTALALQHLVFQLCTGSIPKACLRYLHKVKMPDNQSSSVSELTLTP